VDTPADGTGDARLDEDELVGTAALLLMAGHEATVNVLGNGVLALLRHPDQWRRLVDDPGLTGTAVEELIRFDPPLQLFERTAVVDTAVAGHPVPAGTKIAALLGAAARDPAVVDRPDELDVGRTRNPHLGFGAGAHYCLGAPLARLEVAAVLDALRTRLPTLSLSAEPPRRPDFVMRGLRELRLTR
jgi:cytochrome P450